MARRQFGFELGAARPQLAVGPERVAKGEMIDGRGAPLLYTVQVVGARKALAQKAPVDVVRPIDKGITQRPQRPVLAAVAGDCPLS